LLFAQVRIKLARSFSKGASSIMLAHVDKKTEGQRLR